MTQHYLTKLIASVATNNYLLLLLLHFSAPIGPLPGHSFTKE